MKVTIFMTMFRRGSLSCPSLDVASGSLLVPPNPCQSPPQYTSKVIIVIKSLRSHHMSQAVSKALANRTGQSAGRDCNGLDSCLNTDPHLYSHFLHIVFLDHISFATYHVCINHLVNCHTRTIYSKYLMAFFLQIGDPDDYFKKIVVPKFSEKKFPHKLIFTMCCVFSTS